MIDWPSQLRVVARKPSRQTLTELNVADIRALVVLKGQSPVDKRQIKSRNAVPEELLECVLKGSRLLLVGVEAVKEHLPPVLTSSWQIPPASWPSMLVVLAVLPE